MKAKKKALKRIGCLMLAATMCGAMVACGKTPPPNGDENGGGTVETPPDDTEKPVKAAWELQTYDAVDTVISRPQVKNDKIVEVFQDLNFSGGFKVRGINANQEGSAVKGRLLHDGKSSSQDGTWGIAQWGCSHHMAKEATFSHEGSVLKYEDAGKTVTIDTAKAGSCTLAIRGSEEYSDPTLYKNGPNGDRCADENWPHLYLDQDLNYNVDPTAKHLWMQMDYKVTQCSSDHVTGDRGNGEHAGMFVWFLLITDTNPNSVSFNQTMWFGLKPYDTRFVGGTPAAEAGGDNGKEDSTGLFIYIPSITEIADKPVYGEATVPTAVLNKEGHIKFDLLAYLPDMFRRLKKLTTPQMGGASVEHLRINSTNFGWELMGNNDAEVEISNLNIYAEY